MDWQAPYTSRPRLAPKSLRWGSQRPTSEAALAMSRQHDQDDDDHDDHNEVTFSLSLFLFLPSQSADGLLSVSNQETARSFVLSRFFLSFVLVRISLSNIRLNLVLNKYSTWQLCVCELSPLVLRAVQCSVRRMWLPLGALYCYFTL